MWVNSWSFLPLIVPPSPREQPFPPFPQLFKGKFYHCLGVDTRNITNRSDCVAANYRWVHHKYNFDNLGQVSPSRVTRLTNVAPVLLCQDGQFPSCQVDMGGALLTGEVRLGPWVQRLPALEI